MVIISSPRFIRLMLGLGKLSVAGGFKVVQ